MKVLFNKKILSEKGNKILGLIETDRATMQVSVSRPITAKSFDRTSVFKKLVAYWRALDTHHFQDRYNAEGILIFFITTSQERIMTIVDNLKEARRSAGADRNDGPSDGHFFFGVQEEIRAESVFSYPWSRGNGQPKSLG